MKEEETQDKISPLSSLSLLSSSKLVKEEQRKQIFENYIHFNDNNNKCDSMENDNCAALTTTTATTTIQSKTFNMEESDHHHPHYHHPHYHQHQRQQQQNHWELFSMFQNKNNKNNIKYNRNVAILEDNIGKHQTIMPSLFPSSNDLKKHLPKITTKTSTKAIETKKSSQTLNLLWFPNNTDNNSDNNGNGYSHSWPSLSSPTTTTTRTKSAIKPLFQFIILLGLCCCSSFFIHSGDCLITQAKQENKQQQKNDEKMATITITNSLLANIRFVRSYSEEFMTSSEERERGLQFFGGSSAGGGLSSSSTSANKRISPYFDTESLSTNVTISEGSAFVHLPCRVKQLGDRTLSWIRRQDVQILTVGKFTYTSDQRFQAIHRDNSDDWSLQISYPRKKDAGIYECQVSTMPKMSLFITLNVVVSKAKIVEGPVLYLSSGSTLNLTCVVKDTPEPPDYIFWYHNGQVINYGSPRGIKVHTEKSAQTISKLIILKAQANDSGNYSCTPSNAEPAHIAVHIQNNANPAASIQHGKRSASREYSSNALSTTNVWGFSKATGTMAVITLLALYLW